MSLRPVLLASSLGNPGRGGCGCDFGGTGARGGPRFAVDLPPEGPRVGRGTCPSSAENGRGCPSPAATLRPVRPRWGNRSILRLDVYFFQRSLCIQQASMQCLRLCAVWGTAGARADVVAGHARCSEGNEAPPPSWLPWELRGSPRGPSKTPLLGSRAVILASPKQKIIIVLSRHSPDRSPPLPRPHDGRSAPLQLRSPGVARAGLCGLSHLTGDPRDLRRG